MKSELLFTPSGLLDFLTSIEELKDYEIQLIESPDELSIAIGDTTYSLETDNAVDIDVDEDVVDTIAQENEETYDAIADNVGMEVSTEVEGGILTSLTKSLLLGGILRAVPKLLK